MHIAFLLFPGLTQLDMAGPAQFLSRMPGATLDLVWKNTDPVMTDVGFAIVPTATFADITKADILCIPGGVGVSDVMNDDDAMAWVRSVGAEATWVTSVCTGSLILGAAGLLKGYKATSHWAWHHHLALFGAEPVKARDDGATPSATLPYTHAASQPHQGSAIRYTRSSPTSPLRRCCVSTP